MSLFYDLKLKRQKAGQNGEGVSAVTSERSHEGGAKDSGYSATCSSDSDHSSPASSPRPLKYHHRDVDSPVDISPTRSSDCDSLLSSPTSSHPPLHPSVSSTSSSSQHNFDVLRHAELLRAKTMGYYPAMYPQHFPGPARVNVATGGNNAMIANVNAATHFVGNILYR